MSDEKKWLCAFCDNEIPAPTIEELGKGYVIYLCYECMEINFPKEDQQEIIKNLTP